LTRQISYLEDVAKTVVLPKRISFEQSVEAMEHVFDFIVKESKEKDIYAIDLPKLGVLHKNIFLMQNKQGDYKLDSQERQDCVDQIQTMKMFKEETNFKTPHCKRPGTHVLFSYLNKKYDFNKETKKLPKQSEEVYTALEIEQNK
jgi:hypothetical protein